jgi:hypothetical protein
MTAGRGRRGAVLLLTGEPEDGGWRSRPRLHDPAAQPRLGASSAPPSTCLADDRRVRVTPAVRQEQPGGAVAAAEIVAAYVQTR